jgi:hypothetical protein
VWQFFITLAFGAGMFLLGWWARGKTFKPVEIEVERKARWRCAKCERVKELPAELERQVLVCNNCNIRLEKVAEGV